MFLDRSPGGGGSSHCLPFAKTPIHDVAPKRHTHPIVLWRTSVRFQTYLNSSQGSGPVEQYTCTASPSHSDRRHDKTRYGSGSTRDDVDRSRVPFRANKKHGMLSVYSNTEVVEAQEMQRICKDMQKICMAAESAGSRY